MECCLDMQDNIDYYCAEHGNHCLENLVYKVGNQYRMSYHDGSSFNRIEYCPWCGTSLGEVDTTQKVC